MNDKVCAYGHGPDCPCLKVTIEEQMANHKSHSWKLKPGWKAAYYCTICGLDDISHGAYLPCGQHLEGSKKA